MNTILNAPGWGDRSTKPNTMAGSLRQLVNAAGPIANGMAVALNMVQRSQIAANDGLPPVLNTEQCQQLIGMCAVAAQMLGEVAGDSANDLESLGD